MAYIIGALLGYELAGYIMSKFITISDIAINPIYLTSTIFFIIPLLFILGIYNDVYDTFDDISMKLLFGSILFIGIYREIGRDQDLLAIVLAVIFIFSIIYFILHKFYSNLAKLVTKSSWHIRYAAIQIQRYAKDYTTLSTSTLIILSLCMTIFYTNKAVLMTGN